jgi:uncharacterized protein YpmS
MRKNRKTNLKKWLLIVLISVLLILMIISFSPVRNVTEVVLQ